MPFQPGQSGNPAGRPKRGESLRDILRASLSADKKRKLAEKFYNLAMDGDVRALMALYDNHDGKLPTTIGGVEDDDGNEKPIPIKIVPPLEN